MLLYRNLLFMETKFLSDNFCFALKNYSSDSEVSAQRVSRKFLQNILLPKGAIVFHIISQKVFQTLEGGDNIIGVGVGKVFLSDHQDGCKMSCPEKRLTEKIRTK